MSGGLMRGKGLASSQLTRGRTRQTWNKTNGNLVIPCVEF